MRNALLIHATKHNPWFNLALEHFLMEQVERNQWDAVLYLWQNDHTVVIGRNQNAWAECSTGQLEADGGWLARRSTGGGAVYHDLGNLNFSIILPRKAFDIDQNFDMIIKAVRSQDIDAERSGRNDILVSGLKFSGNAFSLHRHAALHHGTLLVHSDYAKLSRYLTVSSKKLQSKGVSSVRARVTNLQDINPSITIQALHEAMERAFIDTFCSDPDWSVQRESDQLFAHSKRFHALHEHYASWKWRYGESLQFDALIDHRFDWGSLQIGFQVEKGTVCQTKIYSDALDSDYIDLLPPCFEGCRFHSEDLKQTLLNTKFPDDDLLTSREQMTADIAALLTDQNW